MKMGMKIENELIGGHKGMWPSIEHKTYCTKRERSQFLIKDSRDFETEKKRLVDYLNKTQQLGETYFDGKESHSFGALTAQEWSTMFSKHLDHHLTQFGV